MRFADGRAAIRKILVTVEESAAIQHIVERGRNKAGLILIAEAAEKRIVGRKSVVDSNVEVVARFGAHRDGDEVESRVIGIRRGKQRGKARGQRVDGPIRENVGRSSGTR